MMTDLGKGLYYAVPPLNRIQFAWRWLALLTSVSAALWAFVLVALVHRTSAKTRVLRVLAILATAWMGSQSLPALETQTSWGNELRARVDSVLATSSNTSRLGDPAATAELNGGMLFADARNLLFSLDVREYLPNGHDGGKPSRIYDHVEWERGNGQVTIRRWSHGIREFDVESSTGGVILLRTRAWLGWSIVVNGVEVEQGRAGEGSRMRFEVPRGHSEVCVRYVGTWSQRIGTLVSWIVLLGLAVRFVWARRAAVARPTRPASGGTKGLQCGGQRDNHDGVSGGPTGP